jgi:hypothetical protein
MKYQIHHDSDPQDPRVDYDHVGIMYCEHSKYTLGDMLAEHPFSIDSVCVLPLYLYDHSGLTMNTTGFSCPWDSGQVGAIYILREEADEWMRPDGTYDMEAMVSILKSEVKEYDQYLTGDVWGYTIETDDGDDVESCWGFYGRDYCETEAKDACIK